jgi:hypothetical protein
VIGFERQRSVDDAFNTSLIGLSSELDNKQVERLKRIKKNWNFFEGYHWEEIPELDTPELTINYCRAFVNKFVSFELGKGFTVSTHEKLKDSKVTPDGRTSSQFLADVWKDNKQDSLCGDIGQMKSVTGESWVKVDFLSAEEIEDDPFEEYPDGRLKLYLMPTSVTFPEYDPHDRDRLVRMTIMYTYEKAESSAILKRRMKKNVVYKQIWDKDKCIVTDDGVETAYDNKYGIVPFVKILNMTIAGKTDGVSDLEDIIPLNVEYNMKESNVSEIIDYHSAPVTIVYGAKIGNLEKGANKLWGGIPKDAKVENLELKSDLSASSTFIDNIKLSMCEVGGIPQSVLGGSTAISNTSGVALQYINLPLIEKTRIKRMNTESGIEYLNKVILLIAVIEGLIKIPEGVTKRDFYFNEVTIPDTLPKDALMELQLIEQEMRMGLEHRKGAMKRLGKENVDVLIGEIDADRKAHPELYSQLQQKGTNSGMTNGDTAIESVRKETTGMNGGGM